MRSIFASRGATSCERVTPLFRRPVSLVFPRFTRHWIYNRKARGKKLREGKKEELETALIREQCSFARIRLEELFFVKVSQQISKNFWRLDAMFLPCQLFFAPIWQDKSWNTNIFRTDRPIILRCLYGWWMDVETLTRIAEFFAWLNLLHARLQLYRRSFVRIPFVPKKEKSIRSRFRGRIASRKKTRNRYFGAPLFEIRIAVIRQIYIARLEILMYTTWYGNLRDGRIVAWPSHPE